jgi:RNA polymerase sigma-32 factor
LADGHEDSAELDPEILADPLEDTETEAAPEIIEPPLKPDRDTKALSVPPGKGLASYDPFHHYMAELRKYPPLSREEEAELARQYRTTGDREALFRLVTSNLMHVVRVALSFRRAARNLLDLIQEGNLGLLQAIERFDPDMGTRLPTYAGWWIRAYMVKFLLDNVRLVRVGTTNARRKLLRNLRKEKARLEERGFEVGTKLLAEHFGVSEVDVREVEAAISSRDVFLDAPVGEHDGRHHADYLPAGSPSAEDEVSRQELQSKAQAALDRFRVDLSERDLALLDQRILNDDPLTLRELGSRFGITREAVRQAEARLMKRLREFLKTELGDLGQVKIG